MPQRERARHWHGSGIPGNMNTSGLFGPMPVQGRQLSLECAWTGTPVGAFSLECTFDGTTWRTVPGALIEFTMNENELPAGTDGGLVCNWYNVPGQMLRLRYGATSGQGTLIVRGIFAEEE